MSRKRNIKILVAENICMKAAREIIAGVLRYAAAKRGWNVFVHGGHPLDHDDARPFSRPDGIITGYTSDDPKNPVPAGMRRNIPTVFTCISPNCQMKAPFASIYADDQAIGKAAAKCLSKNNLEHFAFIGARKVGYWQKARLASFKEAAHRMGREVSVFSPSDALPMSWAKERGEVLRWIKSLPKPCGIFAVYDSLARFVLDVCREAEIKVPAQVQVLPEQLLLPLPRLPSAAEAVRSLH